MICWRALCRHDHLNPPSMRGWQARQMGGSRAAKLPTRQPSIVPARAGTLAHAVSQQRSRCSAGCCLAVSGGRSNCPGQGRRAACEVAPPTSRAPTASRAMALRATLDREPRRPHWATIRACQCLPSTTRSAPMHIHTQTKIDCFDRL